MRVRVRCNQTGKFFVTSLSSLEGKDCSPIVQKEVQVGLSVFWVDRDGNSYPVTVTKILAPGGKFESYLMLYLLLYKCMFILYTGKENSGASKQQLPSILTSARDEVCVHVNFIPGFTCCAQYKYTESRDILCYYILLQLTNRPPLKRPLTRAPSPSPSPEEENSQLNDMGGGFMDEEEEEEEWQSDEEMVPLHTSSPNPKVCICTCMYILLMMLALHIPFPLAPTQKGEGTASPTPSCSQQPYSMCTYTHDILSTLTGNIHFLISGTPQKTTQSGL